MFSKKNYLLNCNLCDTRKMKEEDYNGYEKMMINANIVVVTSASKSILNRLPVTINHDSTIEVTDDIDVQIKTVNGSYEITGTTSIQEHMLLIVNGSLNIYPGTEEVLEKYEKIHVNGSVRCPKSLESWLIKLSSNGTVSMYPDDCVVLDQTFVLDKYFPLRGKMGKRYYAEEQVIIQDKTVDLKKLIQKKIQFITQRLIVPEELVEECIDIFDETVEFVVIPAGMTFLYGDVMLNEQLLEKSGENIYVYGNLEMDGRCNWAILEQAVKKIIVTGNVIIKKSQETYFRRLNIEYAHLEFKWEGKTIENKIKIKIDKSLLDNSPEKVKVKNAAVIKIAPDVTAALIMERLEIENCAKVTCNEEQESAIAAIAKNVAKIGKLEGEEVPGMESGIKDLLSTKMINADYYVL